jgi:hypothetical protein
MASHMSGSTGSTTESQISSILESSKMSIDKLWQGMQSKSFISISDSGEASNSGKSGNSGNSHANGAKQVHKADRLIGVNTGALAVRLANRVAYLTYPPRLYTKIWTKKNYPDNQSAFVDQLTLPEKVKEDLKSPLNIDDIFGLMFLVQVNTFHYQISPYLQDPVTVSALVTTQYAKDSRIPVENALYHHLFEKVNSIPYGTLNSYIHTCVVNLYNDLRQQVADVVDIDEQELLNGVKNLFIPTLNSYFLNPAKTYKFLEQNATLELWIFETARLFLDMHPDALFFVVDTPFNHPLHIRVADTYNLLKTSLSIDKQGALSELEPRGHGGKKHVNTKKSKSKPPANGSKAAATTTKPKPSKVTTTTTKPKPSKATATTTKPKPSKATATTTKPKPSKATVRKSPSKKQ